MATSWVTLEEKSEAVAEGLDSNGFAEFVVVPPAPPGEKRYVVDHIGTNIDAQTGTDAPTPNLLVYLGVAKKENFVDGTPDGSLNAAAYSYGLIVPSDLFVTVQVSDALADGQAIIRVQYSLQERR